jgi:C-terminal processing protease CtpA/Prc
MTSAEPSPSWADLYVLNLDRGVVGLTTGEVGPLDPVVIALTSIKTVEPNSPAAVAGLHKGDRIVAIDGRSTSDIENFRDVRIRMDGAPDSVVELTVASADGSTRTVSLKRTALGSLSRIKARPNTLLSYFML